MTFAFFARVLFLLDSASEILFPGDAGRCPGQSASTHVFLTTQLLSYQIERIVLLFPSVSRVVNVITEPPVDTRLIFGRLKSVCVCWGESAFQARGLWAGT